MAAQRHILTTQSYAYIIVNAIDLQWQLFVCRSLFTLCVSDVLFFIPTMSPPLSIHIIRCQRKPPFPALDNTIKHLII